MDKKILSWIFLTITMMLWGMSFVWTRQLLAFFSPITIITLRLFISTIFLLVFSISINKLQKVKKHDIKYFILLSLFQPFLYFVFEGYGIKATSASVAAIVISTIPLFTPIGALIFFNKRISLMNLSGLIISFVGVVLIVFNNSGEASFTIKGLLILLGAVFSAVGYLLVLKNIAQKYNAFSVATWQNFFGIIYFIPLFLFLSIDEFKGFALTFDILYPLLALSILASSVAFIFNTYGVRELGPTKAASFTNSVPVFTVVFAWLIIDEPVGFIKMVGMSIVLVGLFIAQISKKKIKLL